MADELKELTAQLDQDVLARVDELKRSLDAWLSEIHTASDPVSPLISDKGVWVLTSPLINTKPLIKSALRIFARDLAEKSSGRYRVSEVRLDKKKLYASISRDGRVLVTWSMFDAGLVVPSYDESIKVQERLKGAAQELDAVRKEYREVDVILKNPDAMVSNGYYAMYLRSFFRRKTHQREVAEIRREFKADIARLEQEMAELQARSLELEQDEETSKCLRFLDTHYYKFPRIRGLSNYIKYRADDALAKEESHGT